MGFFKTCDFCEKKRTLKSEELCSSCRVKVIDSKYAIEYANKKEKLTVIGLHTCPKCRKHTRIFYGQDIMKMKCRYCEDGGNLKEEPDFFYNSLGQRFDRKPDSENKIVSGIKGGTKIIFIAIGLLYFIVAMMSQPDFQEIIIGWFVIGIIYLIISVVYKT